MQNTTAQIRAALDILETQDQSSIEWFEFAVLLLEKASATIKRQLPMWETHSKRNPLETSLPAARFQKLLRIPALDADEAVTPRSANKPNVKGKNFPIKNRDGGNVRRVDPGLQGTEFPVAIGGVEDTEEAGETGIGSHANEPEFFAAFTEAEKTMLRQEALRQQVSPKELLRNWIVEFATQNQA